jgi:outer membrane protein OmpA-like peptidoglycan-associated protein
MKKMTIGVLVFMILGLGIIFGVAKVIPLLHKKMQKDTSDAKDLKGSISCAVDDWTGYFPLRSGRMKKDLRNQGWRLECVNDGGDYKTRMKKLEDGEINFAVVTVDSYILNAAKYDFPGVVVMVIDESKGGDAMVAYADTIPNLDAFKSGVKFKIAYTPDSPSQHLLKSVAAHFNVPALKNLSPDQKVETKDSIEAYKMLKDHKVSAAVVWEPNKSKALEIPGVKEVIGTQSMSGVVVDILVVNRKFADKNPEQVDMFLKTYFRVLKFFNDNPEDLKKDMHTELGVADEAIQKMIDGVAWANLSENCQKWYGVAGPGQTAEQGLVDVIDSTVSILVEAKDFKENPLPDKDPYRIINKSFVQSIYEGALKTGYANLDGGKAGAGPAQTGIDRPFNPLTDAQWAKLRPVGSISVDRIMFQSGTADLDIAEKEKLDRAVDRLKHYPTFRVLVGGHTSYQGDAEANKALSQERAEAVTRYLSVTYNIDQNRMKAIGYGGEKPLARQPGETDRPYGYRLPRVEISLLVESY